MNIDDADSIFPVALTYGPSKPENLDFLNDTVRDLDNILTNGLFVDGKCIHVYLKFIVCDAPARAMVKGIKLYSGYHGCDKCTQTGEWKGRMTYPRTRNVPKRTDDSFRAKQNPEHHIMDSPFCQLSIDMVKCFPVDYMHQSCLGVMRKLILIWIRGKGRLLNYKISAAQVESVSENLINLRDSITSEFQRKPRHLSAIDRWKATELRQFLLYTGKICLQEVLTPESYNLFMALSVATCILVSRNLSAEYHEFAEDLLIYFNEQGCAMYGQEFLVYNVHSMTHLADEAREFGDLNSCAAFPFENYLQYLKKLVRSGKRPVVQIIKRLCEVDQFQSTPQIQNLHLYLQKNPTIAMFLMNPHVVRYRRKQMKPVKMVINSSCVGSIKTVKMHSIYLVIQK